MVSKQASVLARLFSDCLRMEQIEFKWFFFKWVFSVDTTGNKEMLPVQETVKL